MTTAPEGTITLLFTDIEGSTSLLRKAGAGYAELLLTHRRLLRTAFRRHGGYEVDTEGDAFFVAFASAKAAVAAASDGQRALADHVWPDGCRVWVRMGLHTGEPQLVDGGYIGLDVHHAARVMAAGHGGQVLLSAPTKDLVEDGVELLDLGEHRLKDLSGRQPLFQLLVDGLPAHFPALKTLENHPTNLPMQATPLVGRQEELGKVKALLKQGVRVLTLTGPGGIGKTRLALHAAADVVDDFPNGVFFVSLAAVRDRELVAPTIAQTLGLRDDPGRPALDRVIGHVSGDRLLLVLDNLEQVIEAADDVARLVAAASQIAVVVTSREPLRIQGEHVYDVAPLALPTSEIDLEHSDAVRLFVTRASSIDPSFTLTPENRAAVADLVRALDGLPLAIELAAARVRVLTPLALRDRLAERLNLLTSGTRDGDERQRTLRATIAWSYDLLTQGEQSMFGRLSVLAGGARFDAVDAVRPDAERLSSVDSLEAVTSLLEKSLLRRRIDPDGEARYWMLESIRDFATERLGESGGSDEAKRRLADYLVDLGKQARPALEGRRDQLIWLERLRPEMDNVRSALSFAAAEDPVLLGELVVSYGLFFWLAGALREGLTWIAAGIESGSRIPPALRADMLETGSFLAIFAGDRSLSRRYADEAALLRAALNDSAGLGRALREQAKARIFEEPEDARKLLEEAIRLSREANDEWNLTVALNVLGDLGLARGDFEEALRLCDESLELRRKRGDDWGAAITGFNVGSALIGLGRAAEAQSVLREVLELSIALPLPQIVAESLVALAATVVEADAKHAAFLLGSADATLGVTEEAMQPTEADLHRETRERARSLLGQDAYDQLHHAGFSANQEDVLRLALAGATSASE